MLTNNSSKSKAFLKHYVNVSSGSSKIEKVKRLKNIKPFTADELQTATKRIELDKAPGTDGIFSEFIVNIDVNAMMVLLTFFNFVLSNGIPAIWRKAIVIPILKPEKAANEIKSYRPVALTSILCKLYEAMLMARLQAHLKSDRIMDSSQGAFQPNKASIDQVTYLCQ